MINIKDFRMRSAHKLAIGLAGILIAFAPASAFAERTEIECSSLSDAGQQEFYTLSGKAGEAAADKNYTEALSYAQQAMKLCTSDVYTEYTLGRIYQLTNDCPHAYYHFNMLMNKPTSVQKDPDNADIYRELKKAFKEVKSKCGNVVMLEITCEMPGTELTISNLGSMTSVSCPFEDMVKPGAYPVIAHKEGYQARTETINVAEGTGGSLKIPALKEADSAGEVRITCPRGASKFILTSSDGTIDEYVCPWEGKLPADTYMIRLGGTDVSDNVQVVVEKKGRVEYMIPNVAKSNCSAVPMSQSSTPLAAAFFALLGLFGFGALRRRRS